MIKKFISKLIASDKNLTSTNAEKVEDSRIEKTSSWEVGDVLKEVIRRLTAPDRSDSDTEKEKDRIMEKVKNFLDEYLYPLILDDLIFNKEGQKLLLKEIDRELENLKLIISYPWLYKKVKIAFAGRFSSGKSSIINSLLNTDILPTDITPTTAIPTHITYMHKAEQSNAYAINREGRVIPIPIEFFKQIKHENIDEIYSTVLQTLIDSVFINYPSELLSKVIMIDTPGYDPSLSNIDRDLSLKALKSSDLIFWVVDIEDGDISSDALNRIIKKELADKNLCVIINKVDRKPPSARQKVRSKIEETLRNAGVNFKNIFLFSSREKDKYVPEIIGFINKTLKDKENTLPFFDFVKEGIEEINNTLLDGLKSVSAEKEKVETSLEKIWKEYGDKLSKALVDTFEKYAKYNEPWFDNPHFKIYNADNYVNELYEKIAHVVADITSKAFEYYLTLSILDEEQENLQNLLQQARKALKELEKLQEEFEKFIANTHNRRLKL